MINLEQFVSNETSVNEGAREGKIQSYQGKKAKIDWAVNEPADDDVANDIDLDSEENTESLQDLIVKFETEKPFFIQGRAGWGKTSVVKRLAKKFDKEIITVYLDKAEAVDLGGIPVPVSGKANIKAKAKDLATGKVEEQEFAKQIKALPPWAAYMLEHPDQEFLLFFDEMNQAQPDVMNALMPIVLETTICEIKFDNFFVGAAGNLEEENRGGISELSGPLKSRFKPIITWDSDTPEAWAEKFRYLHAKWDKVLGKSVVDKFQENATIFENPREIEDKIFDVIHRLKVKGVTRNSAKFFFRMLKQLAREELSRTQEAQLEKLAEVMYNFVQGNTEETDDRKSSKGRDQIPENVKRVIDSGMKQGFFFMKVNGKQTKFGVSEQTVYDVLEGMCPPEMIERQIKKNKHDGIEWKYTETPNWKKLKIEDPLDDKWQFKITDKSEITVATAPVSRSKARD